MPPDSQATGPGAVARGGPASGATDSRAEVPVAGPGEAGTPGPQASPLLPVRGARFSGIGLLALPLESGDVIAFRHYSFSSLGLPYACVWRRDPAGRWTMVVDVEHSRSCAPFLEPALAHLAVGEIRLAWRGRHELSISVCAIRLQLAIRLAATPATRVLGAAAALLPRPLWRAEPARRLFGRAAGLTLRAGALQFGGQTPTGHHYLLRPGVIRHVAAAAAVLDGRDLGGLVQLAAAPSLGGLPLPRRALLAELTEHYSLPQAGLAA